MTQTQTREDHPQLSQSTRPAGGPSPQSRQKISPLQYLAGIGPMEISFLLLMLLALGMRLWELDGRAMHYDEAIHLHYSWRLSNLEEYIHSPWMHGPFQIELVALIMGLLGDTDFTARLAYVLFGTALVGLPYFLRDHLGRAGALLVGVMLAWSPALLYFSRFGRNDIIMAFWATALLVLMWRYIYDSRDRYLYLAAAVLAFMFATKETSYFFVVSLGGLAFLLGLPQLVPILFRRQRLAEMAGPAGFFILILSLTLPQWSAAVGLFQDFLGVSLVNPDGVARGIVGAPHWDGPFVSLPVYHAPAWLHAVSAALLAAGLVWLSRRRGFTLRSLLPRVGAPLLMAAATVLVLFRPLGLALDPQDPPALVDLPLAGSMALVALGILAFFNHRLAIAHRVLEAIEPTSDTPGGIRHWWKPATLLLGIPAALTLVYAVLFTPVLNVAALVNGLLPQGIQVDVAVNAVPLNFVVAGLVLAGAFLASIALGVAWRGGVWLGCAAVFYGVWLTLYTTVFTNWAGFFSGMWQGLGYWIAQQEVARGNQPWYYYFVGLSIYELLPAVFGVLGAVYFLRKGDVLGIVLALWAGASLLAYSIASEKMPWLLVNITLPFILLAGKYLGALVGEVPWGRVTRQGPILLLALTPLGLAGAVYLLRSYLSLDSPFSLQQWLVLTGLAGLAVVGALLVRLAPPRAGAALVGLGAAALLLVYGGVAAVRATYTYDDSQREFLVYAQGAADLKQTYRELDHRVFQETGRPAVQVDYDMWYPFQWYVRHQNDAGRLRFACFKEEGQDGWTPGCASVPEDLQAPALLLSAHHRQGNFMRLTGYQESGPHRNLLWFPESYRRPGENRPAESMGEEIVKDLAFFREVAASRETWRAALDYLLFREMRQDWFHSEFYVYYQDQ
jgi:predicted membrane-bound mannosyltransferase